MKEMFTLKEIVKDTISKFSHAIAGDRKSVV